MDHIPTIDITPTSMHANPNLLRLTVHRVTHPTPRSVRLEFEYPEKEVKYQAGQYLTIATTINGEQTYRSYSLTSAPGLDKQLSLVIKRTPEGPVSNFLNDQIRPGDVLTFTQPAGKFFVSPDAERQRHLVLIGGGSGITPFYAIARTILHFEPRSLVSLLYANVTTDDVIFRQELAELQEQYPSRLRVVHVLEEPDATLGDLEGRLNVMRTEGVLVGLTTGFSGETEYYLCGPQPMIAIVNETLEHMHVASQRIFTESYITAPAKMVSDAAQARVITVLLSGERREVRVEAGQSILEAMEAASIALPFSCRQGECGTCKGKKVRGEMEMTAVEGLTLEEESDGYVLSCVGFPRSDDLEIAFEL
jgi:ring-1,2-phenylacetyl-CoA epoxidase subunit PaaE